MGLESREEKAMRMFGSQKQALVAAALLTAALTTFGFAKDKAPKADWVTAWATSQQGLGPTKIRNATVRMIARVALPGETVRIRLDNTFGTAPVTFAKATIGLRVRGPALAAGLVKPLTFSGKESVTVAPGASVESDSVALHVEALQDIAVSLFVPAADVQPSQHNTAQVTSYMTDSGGGDQTASTDGKPFAGKTTAMFWLKSVDVESGGRTGAIVAFGDSITDGTCTTLDAHDRWEDALAERLVLRKKDHPRGDQRGDRRQHGDLEPRHEAAAQQPRPAWSASTATCSRIPASPT